MIYNSLTKKLIAYFEAKETLDKDETLLLLELNSNKDVFAASCVMREDLEELGFDTTNVDDGQMTRIAKKMGEAFCEDGIYWVSLECQAEYLDIPRKKVEED